MISTNYDKPCNTCGTSGYELFNSPESSQTTKLPCRYCDGNGYSHKYQRKGIPIIHKSERLYLVPHFSKEFRSYEAATIFIDKNYDS